MSNMSKKFSVLSVFSLFFLLCFQPLNAQVTTATISGVVHDQSGAVLPGAAVTITSDETGVARTMVTDDQGRYHAPNLTLGNYTIKAEMAGFQSVVRRGIELTVGRHAVVDIDLKVGERTEEVVVTGEAPLVETTNSAVTGMVEERQVRELPLNLRSYEQLAALQPGVVASSGARASVRGGSGTMLNVAGARAEFSNFQIDNIDSKDLWRKTPGGMSGGVLGVESIKEFSVLTTNYSAEYSNAAGGVINVITRSGGNRFDGSVYEFLRNDNLDARNFFDVKKPEFRRNQFGAAIGGPVLKNKTFFFANYEGFRQSQPQTVTALVPSVEARSGNLPGGRKVNVNPKVVPYLNLYSLPNGPLHNDGGQDLITIQNQPTTSDYFLTRIDHQFSEKHSLMGRYFWEDGNQLTPNVSLVQQTRNLVGKKQNLTIQFQSVLSPRLLNEARAGYVRAVQDDFDAIDLPASLNFVPLPGRVLGNISVTGLSSIGHSTSQPLFLTFNNFEYYDTVSYTRGRHSMRMGWNTFRSQINGLNIAALMGNYVFNSLELFLQNNPRTFQFLIPGGGRDNPFYIRQTMNGVFFQDDFKMRPNLTLNLGLRYEFITVPTEKQGKLGNIINITDPRPHLGDPLFINPSKKNFGPRVGFAWDPTGAGKTSIRGGFGLFFDEIVTSYFHSTMFRIPPYFVRILLTNNTANTLVTFPDQFQKLYGGVDLDKLDVFNLGVPLETNYLQYNPKNPYMMGWNLMVQQELGAGTVVSAAYVGSKGVALARVADTNTPAPQFRADGRIAYPAGGTRRNPVFASTARFNFDANSFYHSMQLSFKKRATRGFLLQSSYTWSHSIDETSGAQAGGDGFATANTYGLILENRKYDRGNSAFDVRHSFNSSFVWELPFGPGKAYGSDWPALPAKVLGGWELSSLITLVAGPHNSVFVSADRAGNLSGSFFGQRPDLVAGASTNPVDPRNPSQYFGLAATSFVAPPLNTLGNLARGTVVLPGTATVDFSFIKNTPLRENMRMQFRLEIFNALNRANFGTPNLTAIAGSATAPTFSPTFGRITTTGTSSRQIQLALKFVF